MICVVTTDKFITYLELLQRPLVHSLEKRRRGFSGIPAEFIHYADAVDYVMKLISVLQVTDCNILGKY